ncbi:hypothetical protein [Alsobacter sp. R-9]
MKGDEKARQFDKLLTDVLDLTAQRAAIGLPLPKGGSENGAGEVLPSWFASKEGRGKVKKVLAAMKAERQALKALAKFSRKKLDGMAVGKRKAAEAQAVEVPTKSLEAAMRRGSSKIKNKPSASPKPSVAVKPMGTRTRRAKDRPASA